MRLQVYLQVYKYTAVTDNSNKNMRRFMHMQFKTLFMSDEEKHGHYFDLPLYFFKTLF